MKNIPLVAIESFLGKGQLWIFVTIIAAVHCQRNIWNWQESSVIFVFFGYSLRRQRRICSGASSCSQSCYCLNVLFFSPFFFCTHTPISKWRHFVPCVRCVKTNKISQRGSVVGSRSFRPDVVHCFFCL